MCQIIFQGKSANILTLGFSGKTAVITGAGGGLGRTHALELSQRGTWVVVNDLGCAAFLAPIAALV